MSYQEVTTLVAIALTDYLNKPLEAYYTGRETVKTDKGENIIHKFEKTDGTELDVWGFNLMNRKLSTVPFGCLVKVTYTGSTTKGEKKVHQCTVLFDDEKKITVNAKTDNNDLPF